MKYRILICCLCLLWPFAAFAQTRELQYNNQQWFQAYFRADIGQGWLILADGGYRFRSMFEEPSQYLARAALGYQFSNGMQVAAGGAQLGFMREGTMKKLEWRGHQQLSWKQSFGNWQLKHRIRTEQRYYLHPTTERWQHQQPTVYRHRYLLMLKIPLGKAGQSPWFWQVGDELLLQTGKGIIHSFFSQNRILIGPAWKGPNGLGVTATYSHQFTASSQPGQYVQTYIAWIGLRYRWNPSQ